MKACPYCGRFNAEDSVTCNECGTSWANPLPNPKKQPAWKNPLVWFPVPLTLLVAKVALILTAVPWLVSWGCSPATPQAGFRGDWRYQPNGLIVEQRPLPPPNQIWTDYDRWSQSGSSNIEKVYFVNLSGADRQKNFRIEYPVTKNMPVGDYAYTKVTFEYVHETDGAYQFTWSMRGRHRPDFLKLTDQARTFQVRPWGSEGRPALLEIKAVEGVTPF